jgi:hypothetical protein
VVQPTANLLMVTFCRGWCKYGRSACLATTTDRNAIAELPDILPGFKNRRQVFERHSPVLFPPG